MGMKFERCPKAWMADRPHLDDYIADWRWSRQGHLPHAGGHLDQDPRTMMAIDILERESMVIAEHLGKGA